MSGPNFTKHGEDMGRSWLDNKFVSELGYLAAFSSASGSNLSAQRVMLTTTPNFALLTLWKLREGWGNIYTNCWSYTYDRTCGRHLMATHCAADEHGGLIKNWKRGNFKCIATWGRPSHASPFPRYLWRHDKFEVAELINWRIIAFLLLIHFFTL